MCVYSGQRAPLNAHTRGDGVHGAHTTGAGPHPLRHVCAHTHPPSHAAHLPAPPAVTCAQTGSHPRFLHAQTHTGQHPVGAHVLACVGAHTRGVEAAGVFAEMDCAQTVCAHVCGIQATVRAVSATVCTHTDPYALPPADRHRDLAHVCAHTHAHTQTPPPAHTQPHAHPHTHTHIPPTACEPAAGEPLPGVPQPQTCVHTLEGVPHALVSAADCAAGVRTHADCAHTQTPTCVCGLESRAHPQECVSAGEKYVCAGADCAQTLVAGVHRVGTHTPGCARIRGVCAQSRVEAAADVCALTPAAAPLADPCTHTPLRTHTPHGPPPLTHTRTHAPTPPCVCAQTAGGARDLPPVECAQTLVRCLQAGVCAQTAARTRDGVLSGAHHAACVCGVGRLCAHTQGHL
jgi:hypothetical protein